MIGIEFELGDIFHITSKPSEIAVVIAVSVVHEGVEQDWYHLLDTSNWCTIASESQPREQFESFLALLVGSEVIYR